MTSSSSGINEAAGIKESTSTTQGIWAEDSLVADLLEAFLKIPLHPDTEIEIASRTLLETKKNYFRTTTVNTYRMLVLSYPNKKDPQVDAAIKKFIDDPLQQLKSAEEFTTTERSLKIQKLIRKVDISRESPFTRLSTFFFLK